MDLLDRLLGHDAWTTRQLLTMCESFSDEQLDRDFDIGPGTLRATFDHIIWNMEAWTAAMDGLSSIPRPTSRTIAGFRQRLANAETEFRRVARRVADENAWDELWTDRFDKPPNQKAFGTSIAHVITHSMHHRAQILNMLKRSGVPALPEGDVFSWENALSDHS